MAGRLENKVALITGTARGQGRAAALMFAKEGAKIIGCTVRNVEGSKETTRMVRKAGGEMFSLEPLDLSDPKQVAQLMDLVKDKYGRIDVLYNNASMPRFVPLTEMSFDDWQYTIRNELDLVFLVVKAAIPLMIKHGGSIITVSSVSAIRAEASQGNFAHAAAKSGILGLTKQLALELAPYGIRANCIVPGLIRTPPTKPMMDDPRQSKRWLRQILLGRFGEAEDIVKAALFLASDDASYITGADLVVDGGRSVWLD